MLHAMFAVSFSSTADIANCAKDEVANRAEVKVNGLITPKLESIDRSQQSQIEVDVADHAEVNGPIMPKSKLMA